MKKVAVVVALLSVTLVFLLVRPFEFGEVAVGGHHPSREDRARVPTEAASIALPSDQTGGGEQSRTPGERRAGVIEGSSEDIEEPLSARWDELSPAERVEQGTIRFRETLAAIRAGTEVGRGLAAAEAILSALRPEMYTSSEGRERHQELEEQLDQLARTFAPDVGTRSAAAD